MNNEISNRSVASRPPNTKALLDFEADFVSVHFWSFQSKRDLTTCTNTVEIFSWFFTSPCILSFRILWTEKMMTRVTSPLCFFGVKLKAWRSLLRS